MASSKRWTEMPPDWFLELMASLSQATSDPPEKDGIKLYWAALSDIPRDTIVANAVKYVQTASARTGGKPPFPAIATLRGVDQESEKKAQKQVERLAMEDFALLQKQIHEHYFPEFHQASLTVIKMNLDQMGKGYLFKMIPSFGDEILASSNVSATRAQFVKKLVADVEAGVVAFEALAAGHDVGQIGPAAAGPAIGAVAVQVQAAGYAGRLPSPGPVASQRNAMAATSSTEASKQKETSHGQDRA